MKTTQKGAALSASKGLALSQSKGFTLLELLIVIAILAVLATVAVLVINPVEYLRQARDSQRMNDLTAVKGALDLYTAATTTPSFGAALATGRCTSAPVTNNPFTGICGTFVQTAVNGTGWVDVDLSTLTGGSPLPKLPLDPTNASGYFYGYAASNTTNTYELDTKLESAKFTTAPNNMMLNDGGNNNFYYEVGSALTF
jgi:prepilin-type N-terminal cleavage/methylation domain-containing protein